MMTETSAGISEPVSSAIHVTGTLSGPNVTESLRRASDLRGLFQDTAALERLIAEQDDPIMYRVYTASVPERAEELLHCVTVLHPGLVGREFAFTKGHYHVLPRAEVYFGLAGDGIVLLQKGREARTLPLRAGATVYIPAGWAHRTVNVDRERDLVFLSVWPADSGHDYTRLAAEGIQLRIVDQAGRVEVRPAEE